MKPLAERVTVLTRSRRISPTKLAVLAICGVFCARGVAAVFLPSRNAALFLPASAAAAPANQVAFEATYGGSYRITGFQLPAINLEGTGAGQATQLGGLVPTITLSLNILSLTQNAIPVSGTITLTGTSGDEVQATYQGQASPPDASGLLNASGSFTVTGGKGSFTGASGGGTFTGVVNLFRGAFVTSLKGAISPAGQIKK